MRLADPLFLLFLIPLAAAVLWGRRRGSAHAHLKVSDAEAFRRSGLRARLAATAPVLVWLAGAALVVALARPQTGASRVEVKSEGIDIVLALDISGSMRAEDMKPHNRLAVAKEVAKKFVAGRGGDRIGLVVFSGGAYTQCPLTLDHGIVLSLLDQVNFGQVPDGTAIGMALATSTNRLREASGKSKVVILLTDGQNNAGEIDPLTAAEAARSLGVRVYTIGAGSDGPAQIPVDDPVFGRRYVTIDASVDDESLGEIAKRTGGRYFRATSAEALEAIYGEIDRMERSEAETVEYVDYQEKGPLLALVAGLVLAGAMAFSETAANRIP
jgi:Ca-activated chloride channel family protein